MIICACNNRKCDGECRDKNLLRPRKHLDCCPAASGDGYNNGYKHKYSQPQKNKDEV